MLDHYDHLELLALIEGELDPRAEAAVRAKLTGDPKAVAMLDGLRQDRQSLRTLEQPELPLDFLARLEPVMARPMLMEPIEATGAMRVDPAQLRRRHARAGGGGRRRINWGRLTAVAAVILGAISVGLLAVVQWSNRTDTGTPDKPTSVATDDRSRSQVAVNNDRPASRTWSPANGVIHHSGPTHPPTSLGMNEPTANSPGVTIAAAPPETPATRIVVAEFALVLQSRDQASAEQAVQRAAARLGERGALVRNFSYQEARQLSEQWQVAHGGVGRIGKNGAGDVVALTRAPGSTMQEAVQTSAQFAELARQVREQLGAQGSDGLAPDPSAPLVGRRELGPSLEQQLDLSSRGARYTLAVPASQVAGIIEQISLVEGQAASLRMMSSASSENPTNAAEPFASDQPTSAVPAFQPLAYWLTEGSRVRQAVASLAQARENVMVLVPVMVADDADSR